MAIRTWNGSTGSFEVGGNWSPQAAPVAGDIARITAGSVTATGPLPGSLLIELASSSSASPELILVDATLVASSRLAIAAIGTNATVRVRGAAFNQGTIAATGTGPGVAFLRLDDAAGGGATTLVNTGSILVSGAALQVVTFGSNPANQIQNDGLISVRSPDHTPQLAYVAASLTGTGTVLIGCCVTYEAVRSVGPGQTFVFERGIAGATTLAMDAGALFQGTVAGFASADKIQVISTRWDTAAYTATNGTSGVLTLSLNGAVAKSLLFQGTYTKSH